MKYLSLLRPLWLPLLMVAVFVSASLFQQEIIVRFGVATLQRFQAYFPYVVGVGIWFSLAYLFNRLLEVAFWQPLGRRVPVPRLMRDVVTVLIYALALTGVVSAVFQKPIGPFWAASGAGAIVIGLALRNVIMDVFIGLAVNFDRPFEIGDFIMVANGVSGRVVELNWRTTRLITPENNLVVIPNGKIGDMVLTNFSKPSVPGEMAVTLLLDYEVDPDRALRVLNAAVRSVAGTTGVLEDPAPKARIRSVTPQGVEYKLIYNIDPRLAGPGKARHAIWKAVLEQLHRAGLQPATPKQDVFQASRPQRQFDLRSLPDRAAIIARVELFKGLNEDERLQLCGHLEERFFAENSTVIRRGAPGDSMFILIEGLLNVMIPLREGEPDSRVARLQAGQFFGEMSVLTGEARSVTIVAATDCLAFEIGKDAIADLVRRRPEMAETLGKVVAARKLRNSEAVTRAGAQMQQAAERSVTAELVGKMLSFFGIGRTGRTQAPFAATGGTNPPVPRPPGPPAGGA